MRFKILILIPGLLLALVLFYCSHEFNNPYHDIEEDKFEDDRSGGGRIPSCISDSGIDLFAVEGHSIIGLSWNNNSGLAATGGYNVHYGIDTGMAAPQSVSCTSASCEHTLSGLTNGATYHFFVHALDAAKNVIALSCTVSATPHLLAFFQDVCVHCAAGDQTSPCITGALYGIPLFCAWESSSQLYLSRSDDLGDTWSIASLLTSAGNNAHTPRLALIDRSADTLASSFFIVFSGSGNIQIIRGTLDTALNGPAALGTPVTIGSGTDPSIAAVNGFVAVAYENNGTIMVNYSTDDGVSFSTPVRVDKAGAAQDSLSPCVAINPVTLDLFIAYHGMRGSGDNNVYLVSSRDTGKTYSGTETRIDDDTQGQNQQYVSIAVDHRTAVISATWEDRRGASNVYYAQSSDYGASFSANVQTGAGLLGDQFTPQTVVDAGRNVYVLFIDASDGIRPMFSRFNSTGSFDPPLEVSTQAGKAGAAARDPWVFVDRYGTVFTVWAENRQGPNTDIYFARAE